MPRKTIVFFAGLLSTVAALAAGDFGFQVQVALSPKAAALLQSKHESIVVSAMYFGDPKPGAMKHADEMGQIDLGTEDVTIPGADGTATITGGRVIAKALAWRAKPQVLINVYTARRSDPNNLLDCASSRTT